MTPTTTPDDHAVISALLESAGAGVAGGAGGAGGAEPAGDARRHDRLATAADERGLLDVAYRTVDTPFGPLLLAATTTGLVRVAFAHEGHDEVLAALATAVSPRVLLHPRRTDAAARQLEEYFAGRRRTFTVPVDLQLAHGFRRAVIEHLRTIGYGATESYATVARAAGNPAAVRAAGTACARNPLPVVVPCHRVVRSDGSVGQYLGGPDMKRALLAMEARRDRVRPDHGRFARGEGRRRSTGPRSPPSSATSAVPRPGPCSIPRSVGGWSALRRRRVPLHHRHGALPLRQGVRSSTIPARTLARRLDAWLDRCHRAGQTRPTPLLLRYGPGDWTRCRTATLTASSCSRSPSVSTGPATTTPGASWSSSSSAPGCSARHRHPLGQGRVLVLTTAIVRCRAPRGWSASPVRHGVSVVRAGRRHTLGVIFHDAA